VASCSVIAWLAALGGVFADDLVEHAVRVVQQRELAFVELLKNSSQEISTKFSCSDCAALGNMIRTIPTSPPW
jgi:hypothetical protein